ncbi:hypothetical protein [Streptomyces sp. NPDC052127]|uniref:hypothetical protein n=1 Tax=Streptomyces sp. NPDC052127 TaxID=3155679 RepID=UPI003419997C
MSTPRRPLGTGPRPHTPTAPEPAARPGTAAQRAADQPPAPAVADPASDSAPRAARRTLGPGQPPPA